MKTTHRATFGGRLSAVLVTAGTGAGVNRVTIKDTKSRWGSCSSLNNINYNWRIALAPMNAIDYLIAHETAHLRHRDHSKAFWNCVKTLCPFAESGRRRPFVPPLFPLSPPPAAAG